MSSIQRLADAITELGQAIMARFIKVEDRITQLEEEIERLKREPRKSFKQKLKEKA